MASKGKAFIRTFVLSFVLIMLVATPAASLVGKVADMTPGDPDGPVFERDLELGHLIPEDSPFFDAFTGAKKVNILLLGVNGGLTDTIMLVCLDTRSRRVDIISVPRDTYFFRDGYYGAAERKINAAYRKDPVNTAKAVSEVLLGVPINNYIIADYDGVARIVDAMKGVPMDIPFDMKYSDPYDKPPLRIDIPKGEQVLDGEHAVQFLRFRSGYPEGDIGRVKAQQQFMKNAFKQCISLDLPKIARTVQGNVTSDVSLKSALAIAGKGKGITADDVSTYMMPGRADPNPPYYVYPNKQEIEGMLSEIYSIEVER